MSNFPNIEDIPTHPAVDILDWVIDNQLSISVRPTSPDSAEHLGTWCVTIYTSHWTEAPLRRQVEVWADDPMSAMAQARAEFRKLIKGDEYGYLSFSKGVKVG